MTLQSCPTLCDPRDGSPPGSPVPGILQARTLEWIAISFSRALLAFKVKCSGGHPWAGGPDVGLGPLVPWGGPPQAQAPSSEAASFCAHERIRVCVCVCVCVCVYVVGAGRGQISFQNSHRYSHPVPCGAPECTQHRRVPLFLHTCSLGCTFLVAATRFQGRGPGPCHGCVPTHGHRPESKLPTALRGQPRPPLGRPRPAPLAGGGGWILPPFDHLLCVWGLFHTASSSIFLSGF